LTRADFDTCSDAFVAMLRRTLYPLDTAIAELPIGGYRPDDGLRPKPAAVLLGVIRESGPRVLLTRRSMQLRKHPGQVAFPGGRAEAGDASVLATALRETEEETGIPAAAISPLGYLGRYDTITGYRVTTVVGLIEPGCRWVPDRREIEEVFAVPLADVVDPACYQRQAVRRGGRRFEILTLQHSEQHIWGATAAMLHEFGQRIA
jgi:8-oxo-dGTP pyrophosphatase MutT (NUDIX family)